MVGRRREWRGLLWVSLALVAASAGCHAPSGDRTPAGRLGDVRLIRPAEETRGFVFLFSDRAGWNDDLERAATALGDLGAVVVGVDLPQYLRGLAASDDGCHYLISEIEDMSKRLQRDYGFERYAWPILAGVGAGGTLAYAALAQAPAATVAGAASVDPAPALPTRVALCEGAPATAASGGGFSYGARASLPGWWRVSARAPLPPELAARASPSVAASPGETPGERLVALLRPVLAAAPPAAGADLSTLPLNEIPAERPGPMMAVIYSGDGGWRDLDKQIGEFLAEHGVPVVGVDSLRYFWHERPPARLATDLTRIIEHYRVRWGTPDVILVGYSFGAGVLPFAFNRLPGDVQRTVVELSLLGIEPRAAFQFDVTGWFRSFEATEGTAVLPELQRIDPGLVQCFFGEDEEDTLCRAPELTQLELIHTSGGHHFDGDYDALAERILDGARRRAEAAERQ